MNAKAISCPIILAKPRDLRPAPHKRGLHLSHIVMAVSFPTPVVFVCKGHGPDLWLRLWFGHDR
jgi:hypothetical protein